MTHNSEIKIIELLMLLQAELEEFNNTFTPGADTAYLFEDGTKNPLSNFVSASLDYDPSGSQLMLSDGSNVRVYQNFLAQAADSGYTNPKDFTSIVGPNIVWNDGLGTFPYSFRLQNYDPTDGWYEIWDEVENDGTATYFAYNYIYVDENASPEALFANEAFGVNAQGDYGTGVFGDIFGSLMFRECFDTLGNKMNARMNMTPNGGRNGFQLLEDTLGANLESSHDSFGSSSVFGERVTRVYHVHGNSTDLNQLEIKDGQLKLRYREGNATLDRRITMTDSLFELERFKAGTNVKLALTDSGVVVTGGDIETVGSANGLILESPDTTRWRVTIDNTGNLTTATV